MASRERPAPRSVTRRALLALVTLAFVVGFVGSLAIRAPRAGAQVPTGAAGSLAPIHWRVPSAYPPTMPALGETLDLVVAWARESSGGATHLETFEPGKLVPVLAISDAVKDKKVEAGFTALLFDQGKIPSSPLFSTTPFGMEPLEFAAWWYEGGGQELAAKVYEPHGVVPILCAMIGPEAAGWFRKEIETEKDLRGLKIRFAGLGGTVMQRLGASVTLLPPPEIFGALDKRAIDATEFSQPAIDERMGFYKVVKLNYFPGWHQPSTALHLVVNKELWAELPSGTKASIEGACTAGVTRSLARGEALQGKALETFRANGVELRTIPAPLLRRMHDVTDEVLAEEADKDAHFKAVLESQKKFSAEYRTWKTLGYLPRDW